nr:uncharacterized protein LOC101142012 [Gorilla gorilla gorilla]
MDSSNILKCEIASSRTHRGVADKVKYTGHKRCPFGDEQTQEDLTISFKSLLSVVQARELSQKAEEGSLYKCGLCLVKNVADEVSLCWAVMVTTRDTFPGKRADKPSVVRGEHPWEATESKAQFFIDHHLQDAPRIVLSRKPFKLVRSHPLLNGGSHCTSGTHFTDNPGRCGLNSDRREHRSAICKHFSCHFVSFFLNLTDLESGDINEKCRVGLSITACTNIATALPNILLPLGSWLVKQE